MFYQSQSYAAALWTGTFNGGPTTCMTRSSWDCREYAPGYGRCTDRRRHLRAGIWARNLTDEDYNTFGVNFASLGPITGQYGIGTTYGMDVTWEFGSYRGPLCRAFCGGTAFCQNRSALGRQSLKPGNICHDLFDT